jgi:hypothetical protein
MERQLVGLIRAVHRYRNDEVVPALKRATKGIPDVRDPQGRRWPLGEVIGNLVEGKLTEARTLRQVELMTGLCSAGGEDGFGDRRMPDNTAHNVLVKASEEAVDHVMLKLDGEWQRGKKLASAHERKIRGEIVDGVMYDGQEFGKTAEERPAPYFRKSQKVQEKKNGKLVDEKRDYWTCAVVHAVQVSGKAAVCLGQQAIADNDENGAVLELDARLGRECGWFKPGRVLKMADAKHGTAKFFDQQGDPYDENERGHYALTALKGTRKIIYKEAVRACDRQMNKPKAKPVAFTDWEDAGHGREIRRELYWAATNIAADVDENQALALDEDWAILNKKQWPTIRMVPVVKQITRYKTAKARKEARRKLKRRKQRRKAQSGRHLGDGDNDVHLRYFAGNFMREDVAPEDLLAFVREMWEVEVYHNQLVSLMHLKAGDWATLGEAPIVIAGISAIALNFLNLFRHRRLREDGWRHEITFPQLLQLFMVVAVAGAIAPLLEEKQKSRKEACTDEIQDLDDDELKRLLTERFEDNEMDLLVFALKLALKRVVECAKSWLAKKKNRLLELVQRIKGARLLTH